MKETYQFSYFLSDDSTVLIKPGLTLDTLTNPGWWKDIIIDPWYFDECDPDYEYNIDHQIDTIVKHIKDSLSKTNNVTIQGNHGYLNICETNSIININTDIL